MRANEYLIMSDCIENGVSCGWHRAHKHTENPTEEQVKDEIKTPSVLQAFEKAKLSTFSADVKACYDEEDKQFDRYSQHTESIVDEAVKAAELAAEQAAKLAAEQAAAKSSKLLNKLLKSLPCKQKLLKSLLKKHRNLK